MVTVTAGVDNEVDSDSPPVPVQLETFTPEVVKLAILEGIVAAIELSLPLA
jgi:hypothetical protein